MRRHRLALAAIAWGYLTGLALLPQLPGPYWPRDRSGLAVALLAFTLPTAAAIICVLLESLWRR